MKGRNVIAELRGLIEKLLDPVADNSEGYALLDFPDYTNVGDSLIWLGELAFFAKNAKCAPGYTCTTRGFDAERLRKAVPVGPIWLSGGGNFGDLWPRFQHFREAVLTAFPDRKIIQLPQTLHFSSDSAIDHTRRFISAHRDFTLFVRDHKSLAFAEKKFDCAVYLAPDMAFNLGEQGRQIAPDHEMVALIRTDKEAALNRGDISIDRKDVLATDWIIEDKPSMLKRIVGKLTNGRTLAIENSSIFPIIAENEMRRGMDILGRGRVVITDRLHGHILSLLMRVPHVVVDNRYGKVSNFVTAWTGDDSTVHRAGTLEEAVEVAKEMTSRLSIEEA